MDEKSVPALGCSAVPPDGVNAEDCDGLSRQSHLLGDSLFRAYTIETINEATQLYIMAANILGTKPQPVPASRSCHHARPTTSYAVSSTPLATRWSTWKSTCRSTSSTPVRLGSAAAGTQILASIGQTLYFCIPQNDQLLAYWDTVADRLFKIHNSLNLQAYSSNFLSTIPLSTPRCWFEPRPLASMSARWSAA